MIDLQLVRHWHHSPTHVFVPNTAYMVTASTIDKHHFFCDGTRLDYLQSTLFEVAEEYEWLMQAWSIFSNHYHFVGQSPQDGRTLRSLIQQLHSKTALYINALDGTPGRRVWYQYWDTCLTFESSYFARLNYVHNNPVKHGLVTVAEQYKYGSAHWFHTQAEASFRRKVASFKYDTVRVPDDFEVRHADEHY